jgi:hypothetical protein
MNVLGAQQGRITEVVLDAPKATTDSTVKTVVFYCAAHWSPRKIHGKNDHLLSCT